jgi:thymidylate kinase
MLMKNISSPLKHISRMPIAVFEGTNITLKNTIIDQLVQKYPEKIKTFTFPTAKYQELLSPDVADNPEKLVFNHSLIESDFIENKSEIYKESRKFLVILNQYYLSNTVYFEYASKKLDERVKQYTNVLRNIKHITPDLFILLWTVEINEKQHNLFDNDELPQIHDIYFKEVRELRELGKIKLFEYIETLRADTYHKVEKILKEKGLLK